MKLNDRILKTQILNYNLKESENIVDFIKTNPENLGLDELSRIAELVNNSREQTAAYYTDPQTLAEIENKLPTIEKSHIRVLEPSAGVGNFLEIIINKYSHADKLIIDVNDIDNNSVKLLRLLNKYRNIPQNVVINYFVGDFLLFDSKGKYDLIIGNPPFLKLTNSTGLSEYNSSFNDSITKNISGFFLQKAVTLADNVVLVMPKYFLNNPDFKMTRDRIKKHAISKIIDFGEKGFKGVLIETIALYVNTQIKPTKTISYSVTKQIVNVQEQSTLTSEEYPYWLLYRDDFFENIARKMKFGVFKVFRDRQLTNSIVESTGEIRVLKSRNISRCGKKIINFPDYDAYISVDQIKKYSVSKYLNRSDIFLSPNMTYYPRVMRKPNGIVVNGSIAILENITEEIITDEHLNFLSGSTFEKFYRIARNYSTRSLNIDSNSVYFFGLSECGKDD